MSRNAESRVALSRPPGRPGDGRRPGARDTRRRHRGSAPAGTTENLRRSSTGAFLRLIGAGGVGSVLGIACTGAVAVATGQALAGGSPWPRAVPAFVILGAAAGGGVSRLSRRWLLPHRRKRTPVIVGVGAVSVPLALAVGQLAQAWSPLLPVAALAGAVVTVTLWVRAGTRSTAR